MRNKSIDVVFDYSSMNQVINDGAKAGKREALYKNLWFENELTMFFGATNTGKSLLAVQIAEEIARNGKTVMYFDYELSAQQLFDRYENESGGHYVFSENLKRPSMNGDRGLKSKGRKERLFQRVEEAVKLGIKIFIVDNITYLNSRLSDGAEASDFILDFKAKMDKLGASVLLIGHSPKEPKNRSVLTIDRLSGSKNIANFIDACFAIGKIKNENKVYIKQLKARSCAITMDEGHVLVGVFEKKENGFIGFDEEGYADENKLLSGNAEMTPLKETAFRLYQEKKSFRAIAREIGVSDKTAKAWIEEYMAYHDIDTDNMLENNKIGLNNNKNISSNQE